MERAGQSVTTPDQTPGLALTLPLPPGVNNLYVSVNGRRVLSGEGKRFKADVKARLDEMRFCGQLATEVIEKFCAGYLSLFIDFYFPTPLKRDLDGGLKITQDAICEALGINDNRVVDIHLVKRIDPSRPRIEVQLETIDERAWHFDDEFVYTPSRQSAERRDG